MSKFEMKVSKKEKTHPKQIAGAIFKALQEHDAVELQCIGDASIGNATKAMIIAKKFFKQKGQVLAFDPDFDKAVTPDKGEVVSVTWNITVAK
ncbi:stage V sporulation protein S [Cytobacillus sp. FJAT-54145]|uniref:Stage V sporulation protein S n=1 Tax=Cytobacillus spartinae TaxID=3299023 RepID=A0ABW6K9X5_9BACI